MLFGPLLQRGMPPLLMKIETLEMAKNTMQQILLYFYTHCNNIPNSQNLETTQLPPIFSLFCHLNVPKLDHFLQFSPIQEHPTFPSNSYSLMHLKLLRINQTASVYLHFFTTQSFMSKIFICIQMFREPLSKYYALFPHAECGSFPSCN